METVIHVCYIVSAICLGIATAMAYRQWQDRTARRNYALHVAAQRRAAYKDSFTPIVSNRAGHRRAAEYEWSSK